MHPNILNIKQGIRVFLLSKTESETWWGRCTTHNKPLDLAVILNTVPVDGGSIEKFIDDPIIKENKTDDK